MEDVKKNSSGNDLPRHEPVKAPKDKAGVAKPKPLPTKPGSND